MHFNVSLLFLTLLMSAYISDHSRTKFESLLLLVLLFIMENCSPAIFRYIIII